MEITAAECGRRGHIQWRERDLEAYLARQQRAARAGGRATACKPPEELAAIRRKAWATRRAKAGA